MRIELTGESAAAFSRIQMGKMTPKMAGEYLREGRIRLRTFQDVLCELDPGPRLAKRLSEAFCRDLPEGMRTAAQRSVYNWVAGKATPSDREDVFHIAFALGLTEPQLDSLLGVCFDYGLHYREGRDVVYAWFLRQGAAYQEARSFFEGLPPAPRYAQSPSQPRTSLTHEIRNAFLQPTTTEELRACYLANLPNFGRLHTRAYYYFDRYLSQLMSPAPGWERDFSIEEVMQQYLSLHMPTGRSRAGYSVVQRLIKQNWPNATALKNIRLHKADVPRKVLLLLYVATENVIGGEYSELDEEYITAQERLEDHWVSLNVLLSDCGMPLLDPRAPTDWLVLYALTAEEESMSQRMEKVIDELFLSSQ